MKNIGVLVYTHEHDHLVSDKCVGPLSYSTLYTEIQGDKLYIYLIFFKNNYGNFNQGPPPPGSGTDSDVVMVSRWLSLHIALFALLETGNERRNQGSVKRQQGVITDGFFVDAALEKTSLHRH